MRGGPLFFQLQGISSLEFGSHKGEGNESTASVLVCYELAIGLK